MSDSDDDPFLLPGTITKRSDVHVSDVSSEDDDCSTYAALKSGTERKDALKEKARLKSQQQQAQSAASAAANDVEIVEQPGDRPSAKRPRRNNGNKAESPASSCKGGASPVALDPSDEALIAEESRQRLRQAKELQKLKANFVLDDDDDAVQKPARGGGGRSATARPRTGSSSGAGSTSARKVWLNVHTDGSERPVTMMLPRNVSIADSGFISRVAKELALEEARIQLWKSPPQESGTGAGPLDLRRRPDELGLVASGLAPVDVWALEASVTTIRVKLRRVGGV